MAALRLLIAALVVLAGAAALPACDGPPRAQSGPQPPAAPSGPAAETPAPAAPGPEHDDPAQRARREQMVREQIEARGVSDARVLAALRQVPRHAFVLPAYRDHAYEDRPLPIEAEQTISQPYIVALMSELADVQPGERVLEVGTGSGYQAAVLAQLGAEVYSIEIVELLANAARERLARLGYRAQVRHGDGYAGWPERAPFAAIVVTAAPPRIPAPLEEQLAVGGKLVVPVGEDYQDLVVIERSASGYERRSVAPVRFVPMTGRAQDGR